MTEPLQNREKGSEPKQWGLDFQVSDTGSSYLGTPVKSARLEVTRGTGRAEGRSWVSLDLTLIDERKVAAGGYDLREGEFYTVSGIKANTDTSPIKPVFERMETHLRDKPEDLEKIKKELSTP